MADRLVLVAHGPTQGMRDLVFGDRTDLVHPELVDPLGDRVASWCCGPEPACRQTAARLGADPGHVAGLVELAGPDVGRWQGRTLAEVAEADPDGLSQWMSDPDSAPHGGESLAALVRRVGSCCEEREWSPGRNVVVVTALVARAAAAYALSAGPEVIFRIDLAPLARVGLSRQGSTWRLQQLG